MTRSLVTLLLLGLSCVSGAPTASTSPQIGNQLYMKSKLDRDADRRPGSSSGKPPPENRALIFLSWSKSS
ncbi:hypothetical protein F5879DRAFT_994678 [Lentinula edodes]|nr:hypothetical protein F5879DRAFT_994678 [Lentinula edodes]